jgi:stage V sporulation protein G
MTIKPKVVKTFDTGKVRAVVDVTIDDAFTVHGLKVIDGEKGCFVAMPNTSYTDKKGEKKYQDTFHPVTAEARGKLTDAVIRAYDDDYAQRGDKELPFSPEM